MNKKNSQKWHDEKNGAWRTLTNFVQFSTKTVHFMQTMPEGIFKGGRQINIENNNEYLAG